jgi:tetratricopeptide (TPR) repeat protein
MIALDVAPLAMGYIHEAVGDRQKAGASYEKAMQRNPGMAAPVRMLADFYVRTNDPKRAEPLVERLLGPELKPSEFDLCSARRMKAMLLARQGYPRFKEAIGLLNQNLGSPLAATEDKRLKARILLADPGRMHGSEALEIMEGLVATGGAEPDPQDRFDLARLHLARDNWDRCREQMEKLVNSGLCDPRYIEAYVGMLIRQDQLTDADLWLSRLEQVGKPGAAVATRA